MFNRILTLTLLTISWPNIIASKPNVILVMADDLGIGDISPTNPNCKIATPYLQQLADEGLTFFDAHTTSSVCTPTRYGLLTGRYNWRSRLSRGVLNGRSEHLIPVERATLGHLLRESGYHTAMIGKWHLGLEEPNIPNSRGFDYFKGFLCDMIDDYYKHRRHGINYFRENRKEIDPTGHATDLITKWSIDYANNRKEESEPFFMYLSYNAPHTPIQPPQDWFEKVKKREPNISNQRAKLVALDLNLHSQFTRWSHHQTAWSNAFIDGFAVDDLMQDRQYEGRCFSCSGLG